MQTELVQQSNSAMPAAEEPIDFQGDWKTRGGHQACVMFNKTGCWFGTVSMCSTQIPTFWDEDGNSINRELDLLVRKRPTEVWAA